MKREWGGKFPPGRSGFSPLITEFPIAALLHGEVPKVWHVGNTETALNDWLRAVIERRYAYDDGRWAITTND
jgi:hypothetical protein